MSFWFLFLLNYSSGTLVLESVKFLSALEYPFSHTRNTSAMELHPLAIIIIFNNKCCFTMRNEIYLLRVKMARARDRLSFIKAYCNSTYN